MQNTNNTHQKFIQNYAHNSSLKFSIFMKFIDNKSVAMKLLLLFFFFVRMLIYVIEYLNN